MKKAILFMVTNGKGMGHLTRGLAVAKRLKQIDSSYEIIFLSTSLATEVIRDMGFMYYYIPTRAVMPQSVTAKMWNNFLSQQLKTIMIFHDVKAIVFDGANVYGGLIVQLQQAKSVKSIWIKRECYKKSVEYLEMREKNFDLVIMPKEAEDDLTRLGQNKKACHPIILIDKEEAYSKEMVRAQFNVTNPNEKLIYVQLGKENNGVLPKVIEALSKNKKYHILIGEYMIGEPLNIKGPRIQTIRSYPNALYFKGIDAAICAAGYNTFHELIYFGVPTIFFPNTQTGLDDQLARAKKAESFGAAVCMNEFDEKTFNNQMAFILSHTSDIEKAAKRMIYENGAYQAAVYIHELLKG